MTEHGGVCGAVRGLPTLPLLTGFSVSPPELHPIELVSTATLPPCAHGVLFSRLPVTYAPSVYGERPQSRSALNRQSKWAQEKDT